MTVRSYFTVAGPDRYLPTGHTGGAWSDEDLHLSPVAGLMVHHLERWRAAHGDADKTVGRISFDVLGRLPRGEVSLVTELVRPGRTIELLQTTASLGGRPVIIARAWALSPVDTSAVAAVEEQSLPAPDSLPDAALEEVWPGGYIRSVRGRIVPGHRPGRGAAWLTTDVDLVDGEEVGSLATYMMLVDTANGIATRTRPGSWMYPNVDLTVHLFRQPTGRWVGFDTMVTFGQAGHGLTSTVLHDEHGPVGRAEQLLTVRPAR